MFMFFFFFVFNQKTAYEMRISDWSSDVCSSDLLGRSGGYCRGGALCRHGAFRPPPDPHSLDLLRPAGADAELSWAGGVADRRPGGHPEPLLQARARLVPPAAGDRRHAGRHHRQPGRSEEHTSELQSLMRISYADFCLKKKKKQKT